MKWFYKCPCCKKKTFFIDKAYTEPIICESCYKIFCILENHDLDIIKFYCKIKEEAKTKWILEKLCFIVLWV